MGFDNKHYLRTKSYLTAVINNYNSKSPYTVDVNSIFKDLEKYGTKVGNIRKQLEKNETDIISKYDIVEEYKTFFNKYFAPIEKGAKYDIDHGIFENNINYLGEFNGMMQEIYNGIFAEDVELAPQDDKPSNFIDLENKSIKFGELRDKNNVLDIYESTKNKMMSNPEVYGAKENYKKDLENKLSYNADNLISDLNAANSKINGNKYRNAEVEDLAMKYGATREHYNNRNFFVKIFAYFTEGAALRNAEKKLNEIIESNPEYKGKSIDDIVTKSSLSVSEKYQPLIDAATPEVLGKSTNYNDFIKEFNDKSIEKEFEMAESLIKGERKVEKPAFKPEYTKSKKAMDAYKKAVSEANKTQEFFDNKLKASEENQKELESIVNNIGNEKLDNLSEDDIGVFKIDSFLNDVKESMKKPETQQDLTKMLNEDVNPTEKVASSKKIEDTSIKAPTIQQNK